MNERGCKRDVIEYGREEEMKRGSLITEVLVNKDAQIKQKEPRITFRSKK